MTVPLDELIEATLKNDADTEWICIQSAFYNLYSGLLAQ